MKTEARENFSDKWLESEYDYEDRSEVTSDWLTWQREQLGALQDDMERDDLPAPPEPLPFCLYPRQQKQLMDRHPFA